MDEKDVGKVVEGQGADHSEVDNSKRNIMAALLGGIGVAALSSCGNESPEHEVFQRVAQAATGTSSGTPVRWCSTMAELRASWSSTWPTPSNGDVCVLEGYWSGGDGGGGVFFWDENSVTNEDGGTIIAPTASEGGIPDGSATDGGSTGAGRWKRIYSGPLNVKWFGATGDATTDDYGPIGLAIQAATIAASAPYRNSSGAVFFPRGRYRIASGTGYSISCAVMLSGESSPAGGVGVLDNNTSTILHEFQGDLFTFTGANTTQVASGGGVERLRIVQSHGQSDGGPGPAGTAIVLRGTSTDARPIWVRLRDLNIEEGYGQPWTWAIAIDGSDVPVDAYEHYGIMDIVLENIFTHTGTTGSGNEGSLLIKCGIGIWVTNYGAWGVQGCTSAVVTGESGRPSNSIYLTNMVLSGKLKIDYATRVSVIGGSLANVEVTANASGDCLLFPHEFIPYGSITDGNNPSFGLLRYDSATLGNMYGSFRSTRSIALAESQWLFAVNSEKTASYALLGIDVNHALRILPFGDAPVAIGSIPSLINAQNNDVVMVRGGSIRASGSVTGRILSTDANDTVALGLDSSAIQFGVSASSASGTPNVSLGRANGPSNTSQDGWVRFLDAAGNPFWVPIWR